MKVFSNKKTHFFIIALLLFVLPLRQAILNGNKNQIKNKQRILLKDKFGNDILERVQKDTLKQTDIIVIDPQSPKKIETVPKLFDQIVKDNQKQIHSEQLLQKPLNDDILKEDVLLVQIKNELNKNEIVSTETDDKTKQNSVITENVQQQEVAKKVETIVEDQEPESGFPSPSNYAPNVIGYSPSSHFENKHPLICNACPNSISTFPKYTFRTCFGYSYHLIQVIEGYLHALSYSYNQIKTTIFHSEYKGEFRYTGVEITPTDDENVYEIKPKNEIALRSAEDPFKTDEALLKKEVDAEITLLKQKLASREVKPIAELEGSIPSINVEEEYHPEVLAVNEIFESRLRLALEAYTKSKKKSEIKDVLQDLLTKGKCQSIIRAYKITMIEKKIEFIIVVKLQPKISGDENSVVAIQTAVLVSKEGQFGDSVKFNQRHVLSLSKVNMMMEKKESFGGLSVDLPGDQNNLAVEIGTKQFFDASGDAEKRSACQHGLFTFEIIFKLLRILKIEGFSYEKDFCKLLKIKKPIPKVDPRILEAEYLKGLRGKNNEAKQPETAENKNGDKNAPIALAKSFFNADQFKKLIDFTSNPFSWTELRRLHFYLYSRYSQFVFSHKLIPKDPKCLHSDGEEPSTVVLEVDGNPSLEISFIVSHPDPATITIENDYNEQIVNSYFCMEVSGKLSLSFLSKLFCYDFNLNPKEDDQTNKVDFSKVFMKMMKVFVHNYAEVIEELSMFLKTKISSAHFRKYFYQLNAVKGENGLELKRTEKDKRGFLDALANPNPTSKDLATANDGRKDPALLKIKSDMVELGSKFKLKFSLPLSQIGTGDQNSKGLELLSVDVQALEAASDTYKLTMKAFNRDLEIEIGKYWVEDVVFIQSDSNKGFLQGLKANIWRSWISTDEVENENEMLIHYFEDKIQTTLTAWLGELVKPQKSNEAMTTEGATKGSIDYVLPSIYRPFEETSGNSYPLTVGIVYYLMMAFDFYDDNLNILLSDPDIDFQKLATETSTADIPKLYSKIKAVFENSAGTNVSQKRGLEEEVEDPVLSKEKVDAYVNDENKLIEQLVSYLTALRNFDQLGGVSFLFTPGPDSELKKQVKINLFFYENYFWNSVLLKIENMYFSLEYFFPCQSIQETFFYVGKAIRDLTDHQLEREKLIDESHKSYTLGYDQLIEKIEMFLKDKKVETDFCKDGSYNEIVYRRIKNDKPDNKETKVEEKKKDEEVEKLVVLSNENIQAAKQERLLVTKTLSQAKPLNYDKVRMCNEKEKVSTMGEFKLIRELEIRTNKIVYLLNFSNNQFSKDKGSAGAFYSKYKFFSEYDYDYWVVIKSDLEKGLVHLVDITKEISPKVIAKMSKNLQKPKTRKLRFNGDILEFELENFNTKDVLLDYLARVEPSRNLNFGSFRLRDSDVI